MATTTMSSGFEAPRRSKRLESVARSSRSNAPLRWTSAPLSAAMSATASSVDRRTVLTPPVSAFGPGFCSHAQRCGRSDDARGMRLTSNRAAFASALACSLLLPASAFGATRYAAQGGVASADCLAEAPCDLATAVGGAAAGDDVVVGAGEYQLDATLVVPAGVNLAG